MATKNKEMHQFLEKTSEFRKWLATVEERMPTLNFDPLNISLMDLRKCLIQHEEYICYLEQNGEFCKYSRQVGGVLSQKYSHHSVINTHLCTALNSL